MMRFFDAGLVAARRQAFVVAIVTWPAFVFASRDLDLRGLPGTANGTGAALTPAEMELILQGEDRPTKNPLLKIWHWPS